jgi:hypothetical protein
LEAVWKREPEASRQWIRGPSFRSRCRHQRRIERLSHAPAAMTAAARTELTKPTGGRWARLPGCASGAEPAVARCIQSSERTAGDGATVEPLTVPHVRKNMPVHGRVLRQPSNSADRRRRVQLHVRGYADPVRPGASAGLVHGCGRLRSLSALLEDESTRRCR